MQKNKITSDQTNIKKIFGLLAKKDILKLKILLFFQLLSSILDLVGIFLIGVIGSLTISGIQTKNSGTRVTRLLQLAHLESFNFQTQVGILGVVTGLVFILRTVLSFYFTKATLNFLSTKAADISSRLIYNILHGPFEVIKNLKIQEVIYGSTSGVEALVIRVIGPLLVAVSDLFLLTVILLGLFAYSLSLGVSILIIFGLISYIVYKNLSKKSYNLGIQNAELSVYNNSKLSEALRSYRELYVQDRINIYSEILSINRKASAKVNSKAALLPNISKYAIESSVVIGTLLIAATQFVIEDATAAITGMAIYLAAASRIAPGALRIQQSLLSVKNNLGAAEISLKLNDTFGNLEKKSEYLNTQTNSLKDFKGEIIVDNVSFKYADSQNNILNNVNLLLGPGKMLAIVGASGMGKSTFIDLLLGVIKPISGNIKISGIEPNEAVKKWPGAISYIPQNISIINGTILENIILGFSKNEVDIKKIHLAIKNAQLSEFIQSLPDGEETGIIENGLNLSGGQKQKIGIARALVSNPTLLILDEATSSLDSKSESDIMKVINSLRESSTLIVVAHRLSTIRNADQILYFGEKVHTHANSFEELVNKVPDFKEQANILGL